MFKSVPVHRGYRAYLVSGTNGSFKEPVLNTHIFKTHLCNHCMGISSNSTTCCLEILTSRAISSIEDQTNTNQFQMSSQLIQFEGLYDYSVLCKLFRIIRERKHVHVTQKIDNQLIPHNHGTRSRVNNKLVIHLYSKSKCQDALIIRGIKLWNTTPDGNKQSANLARFKNYLKRFILSSSDNPD